MICQRTAAAPLPCKRQRGIAGLRGSSLLRRDPHCRATANGQAVVIGSGISGLAAAEVLTKYFDSVLVLERDAPQPVWQETAVEMVAAKGARRGVVQYNHLHAMTAQGLVSLDAIFQGRYTAALKQAGGTILNLFTEARTAHPQFGVWVHNPAAKPAYVAFCSRHMLETTARQLVTANEKVSFVYGAQAVGLVFGDGAATGGGAAAAAAGAAAEKSKAAVTGVLLADGRQLPAALVLDCSGRDSALPDWLEAAGYERPRVSHATANCGYASWFAKLSPEAEAAFGDVKGVYCLADAPERSLGLILKVEDDIWQVSVGGYAGLHPPFKDEQLMEYAVKEVWHPVIAQLLAGSTQLTPATRFYGLGSTWRHYEQLQHLPEGLVVMADSICSFQPVYGQGMTVAAMEVEVLDKLLARRSSSSSSSQSEGMPADWLSGLPAEFQQAVLPTVQAAWDLAVGSDMKFEGARSSDGRSNAGLTAQLMSGYMASLFELATFDLVVNEALGRMMHVLEPPESLMAPAVLGRVLLHRLTAPLRRRGSSGSSGSSSSPARARAAAGAPQFDTGLRLL